MAEDEDVYRDWVIVTSDGKNYLGQLDQKSNNNVTLRDAFELRIMELRRPDSSGRGVEVVLQNMHVQEPLCAGGVSMELWITKIRYFKDMSNADLLEHVHFVESAKRQFMAQKAKSFGIELVGRA